MGISEEFLKKVLLNINYDKKKTFSKNQTFIFKQNKNLDYFKLLVYQPSMYCIPATKNNANIKSFVTIPIEYTLSE